MTDTDRINWLQLNNCAVGQHVTGQWRIIQNASSPATPLVTGGPSGIANRVSVGDTLREAIDNGMNANLQETQP